MSMIIARGVSANYHFDHPRSTLPPGKSLQALSSGRQVDPGVENPGEIAVMAKLRSAMDQARPGGGKSVLAIAEGALTELNSLLDWMQALSGPVSGDATGPVWDIAPTPDADVFCPSPAAC